MYRERTHLITMERWMRMDCHDTCLTGSYQWPETNQFLLPSATSHRTFSRGYQPRALYILAVNSSTPYWRNKNFKGTACIAGNQKRRQSFHRKISVSHSDTVLAFCSKSELAVLRSDSVRFSPVGKIRSGRAPHN